MHCSKLKLWIGWSPVIPWPVTFPGDLKALFTLFFSKGILKCSSKVYCIFILARKEIKKQFDADKLSQPQSMETHINGHGMESTRIHLKHKLLKTASTHPIFTAELCGRVVQNVKHEEFCCCHIEYCACIWKKVEHTTHSTHSSLMDRTHADGMWFSSWENPCSCLWLD